jgi:hypothetical protein
LSPLSIKQGSRGTSLTSQRFESGGKSPHSKAPSPLRSAGALHNHE